MRGGRALGFPFDGEAQTRPLLGMLAQLGLVGVALVKTRGKRVAPFEIEKLRQDFDDAPRGGARCKRGNQQREQDGQRQRPAHERTITGGA